MSSTTSAQESATRFGSRAAADKYARSHRGSATHRRECKRIREGFANVPSGASVLDLPCGAGRFLPLLAGELGLVVTEADSSPHMVDKARLAATEAGLDNVSFAVADALATGFADDQFDAALCNRLLHHFFEPEVRTAALRELRRVTQGTIVVSFFCNRAYDAMVFRVRNTLARRSPTDRVPISMRAIETNCRDAGLRIAKAMPTRPGISMQYYLQLERAN